MRLWRLALACLLMSAALFAGAPSAQANGPNHAGLVVRFGNGSVWSGCIAFTEPQITGLELLRRSGLSVIIEEGGVYGGAVCKIGSDGCDFPYTSCFCQCEGADCLYWAYYHLQNGAWQYSNVGAGNYWVRPGDVEGWAWGSGTYGMNGALPPAVTFDQVCPPPATNTPTPAPAATATATPPATATPSPTSTPTTGPASIEFWADRTEIPAGQCLQLGWRVRNVQAVYLNDQGVIGEEVRQACPTSDTTYILRVITAEGEEYRRIDVRVLPATSTPSATFTPAPAASRPSAAPAPASTTPPTSPPPTPTSTATHTPVALAMAGPQPPTTPPQPPAEHKPQTPPSAPTTPKVWARAGEMPAPRAPMTPTASPADTISPHWGEYGVFTGMASLLAVLAAWAIRRQNA
ncbi:MAG: hypothetical protein ACUVWB_07600 [Anaerolineae bacterium]